MTSKTKLICGALAVVLGVGVLPVVQPARADDARYHKRYKYKYGYKRDTRRDWRVEAEYAARANSLDPAGDYKSYPNWARVALSPKYDQRN